MRASDRRYTPIADVLDSREARFLAPWILGLGAVLPPRGLGFDMCPLHRLTGLPCPACGLTRSVSSCLHGNLVQSWHYHPFGVVTVGLLSLLSVFLWRPRWGERLAKTVRSWEGAAPWRGWVFWTVFISYSLVRLACPPLWP